MYQCAPFAQETLKMDFHHFFILIQLIILVTNSSSSSSPGPPTPLDYNFTKPPRIIKAENYINTGSSFVNPALATGCETCTITQTFVGPLEKDTTLYSACCSIEEPSYLELDKLRQQIGGKGRCYARLDHLILTKVSVYEFLFDTNHEDFAIDTIYNSDFVVGYFRPGSYANGDHNNNGRHVKKLYLAYCELSPEMLSLTLQHMTSLITLHLDHVRLIPYPPGDGTPSDLLNIVVQRFTASSSSEGQPPLMLNLVDCRLSSLKVRQFKSRFSENKFISMSSLPQLQMLSLASNGLKAIDNIDFFHNKNLKTNPSQIWYLDLSDNELESLVDVDQWLPKSVKTLRLEKNPMLTLPGSLQYCNTEQIELLNKLTELWIDEWNEKNKNVSVAFMGMGNQITNEMLPSKHTNSGSTLRTTTTKHRQTTTPGTKYPPKATTPGETSSIRKQSHRANNHKYV